MRLERVRWRDMICALQTPSAMRVRDVCTPRKEMYRKCAGDTECVYTFMRMVQKGNGMAKQVLVEPGESLQKLIESFSTDKCRNKVVHFTDTKMSSCLSAPRHFSNIWSSSENRVTERKEIGKNRTTIFAMKTGS